MSVLDIDAGILRLKWRLLDSVSRNVVAQGVEKNNKPELMVASIADQLPAGITECRLASVKGETFIFELCSAIESLLGVMPRQPRPVNGVGGLVVEGVDPAYLGVDRWLAMLGAHALYPDRNVMIVDSGTALTLDVVDRNGHFQGGLICPGLNTMLKAMADNADRLVMPAEPELKRGLTFRSLQAVQNGALTMALSLIEREYERYHGGDIAVILCGGDGPLLAENLSVPVVQHPELVFVGLDLALPLRSPARENSLV